MYGNMTREEMIQRLYEGNFTTGELERQLIAKLFEQCCGGGGSSSGGGVFIVHENYDEATDAYTLDKTAAEILEAFETMPVIIIDYHAFDGTTFWNQYILTQVMIQDGRYTFVINQDLSFYAANDNDYPTDRQSSSGGGSRQ